MARVVEGGPPGGDRRIIRGILDEDVFNFDAARSHQLPGHDGNGVCCNLFRMGLARDAGVRFERCAKVEDYCLDVSALPCFGEGGLERFALSRGKRLIYEARWSKSD